MSRGSVSAAGVASRGGGMVSLSLPGLLGVFVGAGGGALMMLKSCGGDGRDGWIECGREVDRQKAARR